MSYSLIKKHSTLETGLKPLNPHPNPLSNYPMFVTYVHLDKKDDKVLARHNKLVHTDRYISYPYNHRIKDEHYPFEVNDIFHVEVIIPHYELNGADVGDTFELKFNMDLNRLEVNKIYKIPFEQKIHSFILREDGFLDYYIHI